MSLDAHFFRTKDIKPYLEKLNYNNPNSLEAILSNFPINKPYMMCFDKSKIINNPCNKVQTNNHNRHGNVDSKFLNDKFLNGYRISLKNIEGIENVSCHQELEVILEKINK